VSLDHKVTEDQTQSKMSPSPPPVSRSERLPRNICQLAWDNVSALDNVDTIIHFYAIGSPTFLNKEAKHGIALWLHPCPKLPYMSIEHKNKNNNHNNHNNQESQDGDGNGNGLGKDLGKDLGTSFRQRLATSSTSSTSPTPPPVLSPSPTSVFAWKRWEVKNHPSANCVYLTVVFQPIWAKRLVTTYRQLPEDFSNYLVYNHQDDEVTFICSSIPEGYALLALFIDFLKGSISVSSLMKLLGSLPLDIRTEHYNMLMLMDRKLHIKKQHLVKYTPLCFHLFHRLSNINTTLISS
jgi:hypothetical protein